jgi:hypothetical protein
MGKPTTSNKKTHFTVLRSSVARAEARIAKAVKAKALRKARVAAPVGDGSIRTSKEAHGARMKARRTRQLARTPGFEVVGNLYVKMLYTNAVALHTAAGVAPDEAHRLAWNAARAHLPAGRMVRSDKPKRSRSDDPEYRSNTAAALRRLVILQKLAA